MWSPALRVHRPIGCEREGGVVDCCVMGTTFKHTLAALLAVSLVTALVARFADSPGGSGSSDSSPSASKAHASVRPGAVYRPKAEPLLRAERPELRFAAVPMVPFAGDDGGNDGDEEESVGGDETEEGIEVQSAVASPPDLRADDPGLVALEPERLFSETVWDSLSAPPEKLVAEASRLLVSAEPEERALGGVLAFFGNILEGEVLDGLAADPEPFVPLAVLDWVRDFGTEEQAVAFRESFALRGMAAEELLALAGQSRGLSGGGRSALDLYLARFGEGEVPAEALAGLVASRSASYDVREQALFKLLEPEMRADGEAALRALSDALAPEDGDLLPFAAGKLSELAEVSNPDGDDEKVWDAEAPVVFFLSQAEGGLPARDLANYLEYALRRDDPEYPPVIELGTWEFANDFLLSVRDRADDLPPSELDALDRIAASLDRLVEYDPAFNPFETEEDDGGNDPGDDDDVDDPS